MAKFITLHMKSTRQEILVNVDNITTFRSNLHDGKDWQFSSVETAGGYYLEVLEDKEQFLKLLSL